MAYRKAKGLCYKCGMKWNPGHKCSNFVSLNVVEELWDFIQGEVSQMEDQCVPEEEDSGDDLVVLSANAAQGTDSTKTVRMVGHVGGKEVIILIDSGSSHTFISEALASRWRDWSPMHTTMQVKVYSENVL
jgi:hypothetical protein